MKISDGDLSIRIRQHAIMIEHAEREKRECETKLARVVGQLDCLNKMLEILKEEQSKRTKEKGLMRAPIGK